MTKQNSSAVMERQIAGSKYNSTKEAVDNSGPASSLEIYADRLR